MVAEILFVAYLCVESGSACDMELQPPPVHSGKGVSGSSLREGD